MNSLIQQTSDEKSVQGYRYFVLDTNNTFLREYQYFGLPPGKSFNPSKEEEKQRWLPRIIQALIEKGHIYKLDKVNGHGYFIQA